MTYKWKKYDWWIYCVIIAIAVFLILYYCYPDTEQDNARYILSAISQGLAAILALVFTITLVVSQMTKRYTAMDKIVFRFETISLMIVFGIGVVTPLLVLKFGFWGWGVNFSIAIASFCVFSLLPFLKGVNGVLKYDIGVSNLRYDIMEALGLGYREKAGGGIEELSEIGKRAVEDSRKDAVLNIIISLSQIGKKSAENGFGDETCFAIDNLEDFGVKSAVRGFEEASLFAATGLQKTGVKAAKIGLTGGLLNDPAPDAIGGLKNIGAKAAEKGLKDTTIRTVEGLKDIGMAADEGTDEGTRAKYIAVKGLWCLGAFVMEYLPEQVNHVIQNLREMEKEIGKEALMSWGKNCIQDHPNLKSSFEEFKRRYNEG
jgi:hypothetical protein